MTQHIGVAISGGGHRATAWGLGALLYLVDSGKNEEVSAISSVSGGSIANAVVAQETDYRTVDPPGFDRTIQRLVRHLADTGLFFWGPPTNAYLISVFVGAGVAVATMLTGIVFVFLNGLSWRSGLTLLAGGVLMGLTARWFERRSHVLDRALARTHFQRDGRSTRLGDIDRSLDHVVCATELQSAEHLYLTPRFLYSHRLGTGSTNDMRLSTAVQASLGMPGAFTPRRLKTAPYGFHGGTQEGGVAEDFLLTDGGVYDNLADQWPDGLEKRLERAPELPVVGRSIDELVIVNATTALSWRRLRYARRFLVGELFTLLRSSSVMYQVPTERRQRGLVHTWVDCERTGRGQRGAIVQIQQSPYRVADAFLRKDQEERARRARAVLDLLGDDDESREAWRARADSNADVPTVLRRLGRTATVDLLEHSYVLAMCNLHVLHGYPLLDLPERERFERLLDDPEPSAA
ncbi:MULTISPECIES: patatin-like phospholipase family protein [unclassified Isoptericola]|uniref:patatin-like phospholipase family protein n=1 Tax=unclassified Isoptericola TaxID=2623355 RepID=UPI002713510E|nr:MULTISPECIES: patatin-like phospholipase family protein [unclassified Isoptericola]MDO8143828.1 hypothetical protein [Isoptericola sp. 178]MDO8149975.1 hypothetical protein [Isoptericola sp. b408]